MKTVNRGWLKRQVEAGKVEARCDFELTDDYAFDNANRFGKTGWMAVRVRAGYEDFVEGVINLWDTDFRSKSGMAYKYDDGTIALSVHGNKHYTLRIVA